MTDPSTPTEEGRTNVDGSTSVEGMTIPNLMPAFEHLPSANDVANWFVEEMRHESNVGGDAWWLSRDPHSSCWMVAHVDLDTQEFWLLDIATEGTRDLLWVTAGMDGLGCQWWQNPTEATNSDPYWLRDGIAWMADQIVVHIEYRPGWDASHYGEKGGAE